MKYLAVIFDIDDTLFDYTETEKFALSQTCKCFQIENLSNQYDLYKSANNEAKRLIDINVPQNLEEFRLLRASIFLNTIRRSDVNPVSFVEIYLQNSINGVLIDGVSETLEQLNGVTKIAATNGSNYPRKNKLTNSPIASYFNGFYSSENLKISKPDPKFFHIIVKDLDIPKEKCIVVGDNYETDIKGALAANIDCCLFNYKWLESHELLDVTQINDFRELVSVMKGVKQ